MSSMTIEQLKKELVAHGVTLPSSHAKKAEYIKLYQEFVQVSNSNNELPSSEEELNISVSSSGDTMDIEDRIRELTDDELYNELQKRGVPCGPVLPNTRRVYEIRLTKALSSGDNFTNGTSSQVSNDSDIVPDYIPDKRIEAMLDRASETRRSHTPDASNLRSRKSTTPSLSPEPLNTLNNSKPTRYSYIETIPKGSSVRYIQPVDGDFSNFQLPSNCRFRGDTKEEPYVGQWSPNVGRYGSKSSDQDAKSTGKNRIKFVIIALIILLVASGYVYHQWNLIDPYKLIEDDVEQLTSKQENKATQN